MKSPVHPALQARRADQITQAPDLITDLDEVRRLLHALWGSPSADRLAARYPEVVTEVAHEREAKAAAVEHVKHLDDDQLREIISVQGRRTTEPALHAAAFDELADRERLVRIQTALTPAPGDMARFFVACNGDDYAANLCARADLAMDAVLDRIHQARQGQITARALDHWRTVRTEAQADVRQYYGEDIGDMPPLVQRAAGYRV